MKKIIKNLLRYIKFSKTKFYQNVKSDLKSKFGVCTVIFANCEIVSSTIDDYTYIQKNTTIFYSEIGKYCSIGGGVFVGLPKHPLTNISTSPIFYDSSQPLPKFYTKNKNHIHLKTIIKNDVWIGQNVLILGGVTIGNGAIIGAGSIVTKDIPDYAIAVGNPCKVIKFRFDKIIIERLLSSEWWNKSERQIIENNDKFHDPINFVKSIHE